MISSVPFIADALNTNERIVVPPPIEIPVVLNDVPKPIENPPMPPVVEPPAVAITIRNPEPVMVPDDQPTEAPPTIDELKGKQIALSTNDSGIESPDLVVSNNRNGTGNSIVDATTPPPDKIETYVDQQPEFQGDLAHYLQSHLVYPVPARDAGIEGRVGLHFVVNEDGTITTVEVARKASPLLDAEALRVVKMMPRWKPGKINGRAVKSYFTLPIIFQID
jgi:protein TonB